MIYLDSSVALAELFVDKKRPSVSFWSNLFVSSRLLEYEVMVRHHALGRQPKAVHLAQLMLSTIRLIDLDPPTLSRALQPFPVSVRTLDAIHLSTMLFLQGRGIRLELASYDTRLNSAATAIGIPLAAI